MLRINAQTGEDMPLEGWYLTVGGAVAYPGGCMCTEEFRQMFGEANFSLLREGTTVVCEYDLKHQA